MSPHLVVCRCDPEWPAMAVCHECERQELHRLLLKRGAVQDNYVERAFAALVDSYARGAA